MTGRIIPSVHVDRTSDQGKSQRQSGPSHEYSRFSRPLHSIVSISNNLQGNARYRTIYLVSFVKYSHWRAYKSETGTRWDFPQPVWFLTVYRHLSISSSLSITFCVFRRLTTPPYLLRLCRSFTPALTWRSTNAIQGGEVHNISWISLLKYWLDTVAFDECHSFGIQFHF